jgi:hypothetical protein
MAMGLVWRLRSATDLEKIEASVATRAQTSRALDYVDVERSSGEDRRNDQSKGPTRMVPLPGWLSAYAHGLALGFADQNLQSTANLHKPTIARVSRGIGHRVEPLEPKRGSCSKFSV